MRLCHYCGNDVLCEQEELQKDQLYHKECVSKISTTDMSSLSGKINTEEEQIFHLKTKNFFRLPLKQIGNSLLEIKMHYASNDTITVIPSTCTPQLVGIRDGFLSHLGNDSFLYKENIVNGSKLALIEAKHQCLQSFVVIMNSLALAMNFVVSPKISDVQCDVLLAICGQPVIVLTLVDGDQDSETVAMYSTSVARGVTTTLRKFMDESINVVFGVLHSSDLDNVDIFQRSMKKFAEDSSLFVTPISLSSNPSKYQKIVTAFWAGVAETRSIISRDGRVHTDYLRFLTKDQCVILMENINNSEVEVQFQTGTGATTLMVEVAQRLAKVGDTLLVCRPQEKERLQSVYPNTKTVTGVGKTDLCIFENIIDETGTVTGPVRGKLWRFTEVYTEREELLQKVERLEKNNIQKESIVDVLTSADRQDQLNQLSVDIEILKLFDINFRGLLSAHHLASSLAHEDKTIKQNLSDEEYKGQGLGTDEDFMQHVLDQMKMRKRQRKDLFPLLAEMIRQTRVITSEVQTRIDYLELAMWGRPEVDDIRNNRNQSVISVDQDGMEKSDHCEQKDGETDTILTSSTVHLGEMQGNNTEVKQFIRDDLDDSHGIAELQKKLETLETAAARLKQQFTDLTEVSDHSAEWEYIFDYLSQQMATLNIQDIISDIFGEGASSVITRKQLKPREVLDKTLDGDCCTLTPKKRRRQLYQLRHMQYGTLKQRDLLDITRNVITADKERLPFLKAQRNHLESMCPTYSVDDANNDRLVACPSMKFNKERVYWSLAVSDDHLELANSRRSGRDHHSDQFQNFVGTCSRLPIFIPPSPFSVPIYWETDTQVQVKREIPRFYLLEMGVCGAGQMDTAFWVSRQTHSSWTVRVRVCDDHRAICTQVWEEGSLAGGCLTTTHALTSGTHALFKFGIVMDVGRGRIAFVDIVRGRLLHTFVAGFHETHCPMFSIAPESNYCNVKMRLVSGKEIKMTDSKINLIAKALYSP